MGRATVSDVPGPNLDAITERDLRDDERLKTLYVEAVRRGFWTNNARDALEFFCLAEKALQEDTQQTPGKLFYALIKQKNREFVSQDIENRALLRLLSHERQVLVDRAARGSTLLPAPMPKDVQETLFGRDVGYHHGIMAQCFLPQKPLPVGTTRYVTSHGRASMAVRAGILADPKAPNTFVECTVPFGSRARLIVPYIIGYAVVRKSPVVDLGRSLRRFLAALGVPYSGQNGRMITEQVRNIAAAEFVLGEWSEEVQRTRKASVAKEISFWVERDPEEQKTLWTPKMVLSDEFYQAIQTRRVPIDMRHLVQLARSPRRMDLYTWLAYRLPSLSPRTPTSIPIRYLQPIFAPDITPAHARLFKSRLLGDLEAIKTVYPGFNIDVEGNMVRLRYSAPPVPANVARLA